MTEPSAPATPQKVEEIDPIAFRSAAGNFLTGITIATTMGSDGMPRGITANSFTTVSLDPPLILFCVGRSSRSFEAFDAADAFAVNVLSSTQRQLSSTFGSRKEDKFEGIDWHPGSGGSPIFPDSIASFDCLVEQKIDAGDHIILIGRVVALARTSGTPLGYFGGNYIDFAMQRDAVDASVATGNRFGGLFRLGDRLLFLEKDGELGLPFAPSLGEENREPESLLGQLDRLGIKARLEFVYSVFNDEPDRGLTTIYLGEIDDVEEGTGGFELIREDDVPFDRIKKFHGLIRRYSRERSEDKFGLYVGTMSTGTIHRTR